VCVCEYVCMYVCMYACKCEYMYSDVFITHKPLHKKDKNNLAALIGLGTIRSIESDGNVKAAMYVYAYALVYCVCVYVCISIWF